MATTGYWLALNIATKKKKDKMHTTIKLSAKIESYKEKAFSVFAIFS